MNTFKNISIQHCLLIGPVMSMVLMVLVGFLFFTTIEKQKNMSKNILSDKLPVVEMSSKLLIGYTQAHSHFFQIVALKGADSSQGIIDNQLSILSKSVEKLSRETSDFIQLTGLNIELSAPLEDLLKSEEKYKSSLFESLSLLDMGAALALNMGAAALDDYEALHEILVEISHLSKETAIKSSL
jgi:hypothetical protein